MDYRQRLEQGHGAFAALLRAWHERNGWSHRVLPALAERLDLGRLHSSQLSNLRNRKLASPGPEVFLALGCCNQWLAQTPIPLAEIADQQELSDGIGAAPHALIDAAGLVLGAGELLEIFVGLRPLPPGFDLRISEAESPALSAALADLLAAGQPWRKCSGRESCKDNERLNKTGEDRARPLSAEDGDHVVRDVAPPGRVREVGANP